MRVAELRVVFINAVITSIEDPNLKAALHEEWLHLLDCKTLCYSFFSFACGFQELFTGQSVSLLFALGEQGFTVVVHERIDPALIFKVVILINGLFERVLGQIKLITNICILNCNVFCGFLDGPFRVGGLDFFMLFNL